MAREGERRARSAEAPVVGGLPEAPGIVAAMRLTPGLELHLRGLADELLVKDYPGATLTRGERELLATWVSSRNDCFYCMDSHGAFAGELLRRDGRPEVETLVDAVKDGDASAAGPKMSALFRVARVVREAPRALTGEDVAAAIAAGATDADVQLAVLIASAFSMYNRMVDGLRARTPPTVEAFTARAVEIAERGYRAP